MISKIILTIFFVIVLSPVMLVSFVAGRIRYFWNQLIHIVTFDWEGFNSLAKGRLEDDNEAADIIKDAFDYIKNL